MKKLFAAGLILILLLAGCGKNGIAKTYAKRIFKSAYETKIL